MIRACLLVLLVFFSCCDLFAQAGALSQMVLNRLSRNRPNGHQDAVGSPYLTDEYGTGEVYTSVSQFRVFKMRYNVFEDDFEYELGEVVYAIDPVDAVKRINLGKETFIVDEYDFRSKLRKGFFIVLDTGIVNLYLKKSVEFRDRELPTATKYLGEPPRFIKGPDSYYVKIGNDIPKKYNSFDDLIAKFPDRKEELIQFVKKNKLVARKAADILEFVRFCNSKSGPVN